MYVVCKRKQIQSYQRGFSISISFVLFFFFLSIPSQYRLILMVVNKTGLRNYGKFKIDYWSPSVELIP